MQGRSVKPALAIAVAVLVQFWPGSAEANEFERFQKARSAYEALDYELAADLFLELVGGDPPSLTSPALVIESRKYLAASLLFLGRMEAAEAQLELLLAADPDYVLDPLAFPDEFQRMFGRAKARLAEERDAKAAEVATTRAKREAEQSDQLRREQVRRLRELAQTERVHEFRSRWVALVPFGVGQFQNKNDGLGVGLAVSQGLLLSVAMTSFFLHENLRDQQPDPAERGDAELAESIFRYTNQISMILFSGVAIAGIIEAQVKFDERRVYERRRELPPDLRDLQLSISPVGAVVSGAF